MQTAYREPLCHYVFALSAQEVLPITFLTLLYKTLFPLRYYNLTCPTKLYHVYIFLFPSSFFFPFFLCFIFYLLSRIAISKGGFVYSSSFSSILHKLTLQEGLFRSTKSFTRKKKKKHPQLINTKEEAFIRRSWDDFHILATNFLTLILFFLYILLYNFFHCMTYAL